MAICAGASLGKRRAVISQSKCRVGSASKAFEPLPFDGLDGTYRFRQALVDEGLVDTWTDVTPVHYTFKK
jgi:hypothetical protein